MVAATIGLSVMPSPPDPGFDHGDKLEHVVTYGALMFWFCQLHAAGRVQIAFAIGFIALGIGLEFVQGALAYRSYEEADMLANSIGVVAGWAVARVTGSHVFARIERLLGA